jgi:hypothetical protein
MINFYKFYNILESVDLSIISEKIFSGMSPEIINRGHCYNWALAAKYYLKSGQLFADDAHAFIYYDGRYYDATEPLGVDN